MPPPSVFPLSPYSLKVSWEKPRDNEARGEVMGYSINVITKQKVLPVFSQVLLLLAICFLCLLIYQYYKVVPALLAMPNSNLPMERACCYQSAVGGIKALSWQIAHGGDGYLSVCLSLYERNWLIFGRLFWSLFVYVHEDDSVRIAKRISVEVMFPKFLTIWHQIQAANWHAPLSLLFSPTGITFPFLFHCHPWYIVLYLHWDWY